MRQHRELMMWSGLIVMGSVILIRVFNSCSDNWIINTIIGILSSAIVLFWTSFVGYKIEENKTFSQYYWNLMILKNNILTLNTIEYGTNMSDFYISLNRINELLSGYFAQVDQAFYFYKIRKKVQQLLKINGILHSLYMESSGAEIHIREYMGKHIDEKGERTYTIEQLHTDIKSFCKIIDNYEGKPFVIYLEKEIEKYRMLIAKKSNR